MKCSQCGNSIRDPEPAFIVEQRTVCAGCYEWLCAQPQLPVVRTVARPVPPAPVDPLEQLSQQLGGEPTGFQQNVTHVHVSQPSRRDRSPFEWGLGIGLGWFTAGVIVLGITVGILLFIAAIARH